MLEQVVTTQFHTNMHITPVLQRTHHTRKIGGTVIATTVSVFLVINSLLTDTWYGIQEMMVRGLDWTPIY